MNHCAVWTKSNDRGETETFVQSLFARNKIFRNLDSICEQFLQIEIHSHRVSANVNKLCKTILSKINQHCGRSIETQYGR